MTAKRATGEDTLEAFAYEWGMRHAVAAGIGRLPWERWQLDPVGYVRERLKESVVMPHQAEILSALANGIAGNGPPRVAVRSGQKPGKTRLDCWAALWFYECFPNAIVYMCAAIEAQTKNVLWAEMARVIRDARARDVEIDATMSKSPAGGIVSTDESRKIVGMNAREVEALAGLSGRMLFIVDEASSLPADKAEAFAGNTLGGGAMLWTSNPTRSEGPFFECFFRQKEFWQTFHVNCEKVAQWVERSGQRKQLPNVVNWDKILEAREMYGGPDSAFYRIRVLGDFILNEQGKAIPLELILRAQAAWHDLSDDGPLTIGLDPAGPGNSGDETAYAIRRGEKILNVFTYSGLKEDAVIEHLLAFLRTYRVGLDEPTVIVDSEGPIGGSLYGRLRAITDGASPGHKFNLYGVRASFPARREPQIYDRCREEVFANLAKWLREGGGIPADAKLEADLHAPDWIGQVSGKLKLTPKERLRELLGRSPDRGDAVALAVWRPYQWIADAEGTPVQDSPDPPAAVGIFSRGGSLDPYAANDWWQAGR